MKKVDGIPYLYERNGNYIYRRPVPPHYQSELDKTEIKKSLKTKDRTEALFRYAQLQNTWDAHFNGEKSKGSHGDSLDDLERKNDILNGHGLTFKTMRQLMEENAHEEASKRIAIWDELGQPTGLMQETLLSHNEIDLKLSDLVEAWKKAKSDDLAIKTSEEKQKKVNPKKLTVQNFIKLIGDHSIKTVNNSHARKYVEHLVARSERKEIKLETAQKHLANIKSAFNTVIRYYDLKIANPFAALSIKSDKSSRKSIPREMVTELVSTLSEPRTGRKSQVADIINIIAHTGMSAKEILGILREDIVSGHEFPHLILQPNGKRQLKSTSRARIIPLIPSVLKLVEKNIDFNFFSTANAPDLFGKYGNDMLRDILKTNEYTLYCLRHSFKDRLRHNQVQLEIQNYLMGHTNLSMGAHYGNLGDVELLYKAMLSTQIS